MAQSQPLPPETTVTDEHKMTEKGKELYHSHKIKYLKQIDGSWETIENLLEELSERSKELKPLRKLEKNILKSREKYCENSNQYIEFLTRKNNEDSNDALPTFKTEFKKCNEIIDNTLQQIKTLKLTAAETMSVVPVESVRSNNSGKSGSISSSAMARKRVNAEVQRTKLQYAEQQTKLIKQKARLSELETQSKALKDREKAEVDADLALFKQQTEAAVAEVEVKVLEEAESDSRSLSLQEDKEYLQKVKMTLTEKYVNEQFNEVEQLKSQDKNNNVPQDIPNNQDKFSSHTPAPRNQLNIIPTSRNLPKFQVDDLDRSIVEDIKPEIRQKQTLNPYAADFELTQPPLPPNHDQSVVSDLTKFLLKKDLLLSRFQNFDDCPETYASWKATFKSITEELSVTAFEEMDLLVKWLGRESSKFSQNIRASNVNNPNAGLRRIWERLDERYGRPEMVEAAIKTKLQKFPKLTNKDHSRLYELLDILTQIESSKENETFSNLLSYFDSSSGVLPIVDKLPYNIQEKWTTRASQYKLRNNVPFPPFSYLVQFIREVSAVKNDPAFIYSNTETSYSRKNETRKVNHGATSVFNRKTDVNIKQKEEKETVRCPIHKANHHLNTCRAFKAMTYEERRKYLKDNNICFKCCHSTTHMSRNCTVTVKCDHCGSNYHITAMHVTAKSSCPDGGEKSSDTTQNANDQTVSSKCTFLCGFSGKSCGKTVQVRVYPKNFPDKAVNVYAILDDQSNRTLAKTELFDQLGINTSAIQYTMSSCAGRTIMNGRCAESLIVESLSGNGELEIHSVIECSAIPDEKSEIPTPDIAKSYPHLREIAHQMLDLNPNIDIQLLIGRDVPEAHHVFRQLTGPKGTPFAQELFFGWVIIGDVCLGKVHKPNFVNVNKTNVMNNGRGTIFEPCINTLYVKENTELAHIRDNVHSQRCNNDPLFIKTKDDNKIGTSVQDRLFLNLMDSEFKKDSNGHWTAPLPFRPNRQRLPNNRSQAWKRAQILDKSFQQNFTKKTHFVEFMQKVLVSGAAEVAPIITDEECWYLPLFGVYHQNKPNQIRGVFDSSASFEGVSLNSVMMSGPDLTNNLLGILLRFRSDQFAATADIEQMFYQFYVREEDRNFLRFFWYKDNNPDNPLIEHRMCVNVFGNSASPAVATYGLRKTVENSNETFGSDVKTFVNRDFYVDDGLISLPESEQVIDLITRTQMALKTGGNIRLHKITSNSSDVMKAFPADDIGKDLKNLNLCEDYFPVQHSLGLAWDLNTDSFIFTPLQDDKPCTRRGILSSLNSIFDPIGFLSPLTISGKILLRDASPPGTDWDECLSQSFQEKWNEWRISVLSLRELSIPRMYIPMSISVMDNLEVHVFSDASEKAVAASAYLRAIDTYGTSTVGFIMGKSKLAPLSGNTIPRLELCGAVLATEIGKIISENLDVPLDSIKYYSDSKIVLGYITNQTRRFHTYVSNRIERILSVSSSNQWQFVPTHLNPSDCGTRYSISVDMENNPWLLGPKWMKNSDEEAQCDVKILYPLVSPDNDKEIRKEISASKTSIDALAPIVGRFKKFSSWRRLVKAISFLQHVAQSFSLKDKSCQGWHFCQNVMSVDSYQKAELFILKECQKEVYSQEIECLARGTNISKQSSLISLSPFLDSQGLIRVGGRLEKAKSWLPTGEINPIIIPKNSYISKLLIDRYHNSVKHQGRHLTEGALRSAGYWLIRAKRLISSFIQKCVICRKLRGKFQEQKMADLPSDRLTPGPPFTFVGLDTFGPWQVLTRKTRGGSANSKRWAILFTCMTTRAVHIEVIESLSSSCFINSLRRFQSLRGQAKVYRSDRGTNFIGATDDSNIEAINVEDLTVKNFLCESGSVWKFNPPHSSHMGGVWERMIGVTRRILDAVILTSSSKSLTHESLTTFLAEVTAIINARPIAQISSDPEVPLILSPSMLLTGKQDYLPVITDTYNLKDMYRAQWKHVQVLSDIFWKHWRSDYLQCLQQRRKWHVDKDDIKVGHVILMRDKSIYRGEWPLGIVEEVFKSDDGKVHKARLRIYKEGKAVTYTRPISEMVLLVD